MNLTLRVYSLDSEKQIPFKLYTSGLLMAKLLTSVKTSLVFIPFKRTNAVATLLL
jgi:hypothetical protein